MDEYMNRKLDAYGQPLKFLKAYKVMTIIVLVFLCAVIVPSLLDISSLGLNFSITVLVTVTGILSLVALPLLDKFAFFTTLSFVSIFIIRISNAIIGLIIAAAAIPEIPVEGDVFTQAGAMVGNSISAMASVISWSACTMLAAMAVPLVLFAIQVIKHKKLFFTELKQLEAEWVEDDTSHAEELQQEVVGQEVAKQ